MTPAEEQSLAIVARAFCAANGWTFTGAAGQGAFKATYRVVQPQGDLLALKVCLPGAVTERAVREIEAMAALSAARHPSLPSFLALVEFDHAGIIYTLLIEEFLEGGTLSAVLRQQGTLTRDQTIRIARQIISALDEVHRAGLVHRDIKPDNLVFRADGTIVLVDFGLVRDLAQYSLTHTWLARGPGTPLFSAPEQLNNDKNLIDWRTDQFALGVALALSAYGRHPFQHVGDSVDRVIARVAARERPSPDFVAWTATAGLTAMARMVEPWPVGRYRRSPDLAAAWTTP